MNLQSFLLGMLAGVLVTSVLIRDRAQSLANEARHIVQEFLESLFPFLF